MPRGKFRSPFEKFLYLEQIELKDLQDFAYKTLYAYKTGARAPSLKRARRLTAALTLLLKRTVTVDEIFPSEEAAHEAAG